MEIGHIFLSIPLISLDFDMAIYPQSGFFMQDLEIVIVSLSSIIIPQDQLSLLWHLYLQLQVCMHRAKYAWTISVSMYKSFPSHMWKCRCMYLLWVSDASHIMSHIMWTCWTWVPEWVKCLAWQINTNKNARRLFVFQLMCDISLLWHCVTGSHNRVSVPDFTLWVLEWD